MHAHSTRESPSQCAVRNAVNSSASTKSAAGVGFRINITPPAGIGYGFLFWDYYIINTKTDIYQVLSPKRLIYRGIITQNAALAGETLVHYAYSDVQLKV